MVVERFECSGDNGTFFRYFYWLKPLWATRCGHSTYTMHSLERPAKSPLIAVSPFSNKHAYCLESQG